MIEEHFFFQEIDRSTFTFSKKRFPFNDSVKRLELDTRIFNDVKGESESLGGYY